MFDTAFALVGVIATTRREAKGSVVEVGVTVALVSLLRWHGRSKGDGHGSCSHKIECITLLDSATGMIGAFTAAAGAKGTSAFLERFVVTVLDALEMESVRLGRVKWHYSAFFS
jgi:hypothetical protein